MDRSGIFLSQADDDDNSNRILFKSLAASFSCSKTPIQTTPRPITRRMPVCRRYRLLGDALELPLGLALGDALLSDELESKGQIIYSRYVR
jgi:hypothetical protein